MTGAPQQESGTHVMQCMEVWGGNRAIDNGVTMPGLDAWVFARPMGTDKGGDIHYVTSCATGRLTRLMVADVSGHGAAVAQVADSLRRLLCKFSNYLDQTRFIRAVNERFGEVSRGDEEFSGLFATAVVATYWTPTDELTICNAGHPHPLMYEAKSRRWRALVPSPRAGKELANLPLGIAEPTAYDQAVFRMRRGDLVMFYTDSLIEAREHAAGAGGKPRQLGEDGLLNLLQSLDATQPESLVRRLIGLIAKFSRGEAVAAGEDGAPDPAAGFDDDVTVLLLRRNDLKPRPSILLGIAGGFRIAWHAAKSLAGGSMPASWPEIRRQTIGGAFSRALGGKPDGDA